MDRGGTEKGPNIGQTSFAVPGETVVVVGDGERGPNPGQGD